MTIQPKTPRNSATNPKWSKTNKRSNCMTFSTGIQAGSLRTTHRFSRAGRPLLEETDLDRESVDKTGKLSLTVLGGNIKTTEEFQLGSKRTIDPHDLIATDVLSYLQSNQLISVDVTNAPHGALVIALGTLVFADRHILELATVIFDGLIADEERKPKSQQDKSLIQSWKFIKNFLGKIPLPSAFLLQTNDGVQLAGAIKEAGMEEPISTYYFKHCTGN